MDLPALIVAALSLVVAALSLVVTIVGTALANRRANESHALAREALDRAQRADTDALWSRHIENVQHIFALDPLTDDVRQPLRDLRISGVGLVDALPWPGLGEWLGAEHALGATILRHVMESPVPADDIEQRMESLGAIRNWAMAFMNNLRMCRRDGNHPDEISKLTAHAVKLTRTVHERHGWPLPADPPFVPIDKAEDPSRS